MNGKEGRNENEGLSPDRRSYGRHLATEDAPSGLSVDAGLRSPLELINHPAARRANVSLFCKRDDLYTPAPGSSLQGNKVRKLAPVLRAALAAPAPPRLVSFGGAYSNHLSALATAGRLYGLPVTIFVRGEEVDNPVLRQAAADGAELLRISRTEYRQKSDPAWLAARRRELATRHSLPTSSIWFIPEGGTSPEAVHSVGALCHEIVVDLGAPPDYLCISAGTGGTAAGLIATADPATRIEVYPALKGNWMAGEIRKLLPEGVSENWTCLEDYHFGGYGKFPAEWVVADEGMAKKVVLEPGLPVLEPVYTAKLFAGVLDRMGQRFYPANSSVVVVHSGGVY